MGETDPQTNVGAFMLNALGGLPAVISSSAIGALNRLVTGVADVPGAVLNGWKEQIEDRNYERRTLRRKLADAAVSKAIEDDAIVQRTVDRLMNEQFRKQVNRESIAIKTARILSEKADQESQENDKLDEDWFNSYVKHGEDMSSEDAQELWAKVLAGEIQQKGSFSRSTLRFLADLDQKTAQRIELVFAHSIGNVIPKIRIGSSGPIFSEARILEDIGLVSGVSGGLAKPLGWGDPRVGGLNGRSVFFQLITNQIGSMKIEAVFLSEMGREIALLMGGNDEANVVRSIFSQLDTSNIEAALIWEYEKDRNLKSPPEVLWGIAPTS